MEKTKVNFAKIISICGACIAFYIGSGFATMQELMQYDVSYGSQFWIVIFVSAAIYLYTNWSFIENGNRLQITRGGDIYKVYCGKYVGKFFDVFSAIFCYACYFVMCGGANSTMAQQWGAPNGVGAIVLAITVIATAYFGLNGILNALGMIGPVIIVIILTVSTVCTISGAPQLAEGLAKIDGGMDLVKVGNNPWASGASYGGFVILWFAAFLAEIGASNKKTEANIGMILSTIFIFGATTLCCLALASHIDLVAGVDIPSLILAGTLSPLFANIFAVIIFCGIYTTAVPLLWTGVGLIAEQGTKKYKIATIVLGVAGPIIAMFLPYKALVNVLYGLNGYLGFILVAFMIVNDVMVAMKKKA